MSYMYIQMNKLIIIYQTNLCYGLWTTISFQFLLQQYFSCWIHFNLELSFSDLKSVDYLFTYITTNTPSLVTFLGVSKISEKLDNPIPWPATPAMMFNIFSIISWHSSTNSSDTFTKSVDGVNQRSSTSVKHWVTADIKPVTWNKENQHFKVFKVLLAFRSWCC